MRCNIPEGVEVKLSAEIIKPLVMGQTIITIDFPKSSRYSSSKPDGLKEFLEANANSRVPLGKIQDVKTKGKFMYWSFNDEWYMYCTFGMTGQWSPKEGKHVCMHMALVDSIGRLSEIYFNDPRHFGTIKFVKGKDKLNRKLYELGWDPLTQDWEAVKPFMVGTLISTSKPIGQILMDQKVFAGVGNYIRAEALYQARISPWRVGSSLSRDEIDRLGKALVEVMKESYTHQGATIHTYATPYGEEGKYSSCFKVYGQKQDPLGNPIKKETTPEGRTIHWCPAIQS